MNYEEAVQKLQSNPKWSKIPPETQQKLLARLKEKSDEMTQKSASDRMTKVDNAARVARQAQGANPDSLTPEGQARAKRQGFALQSPEEFEVSLGESLLTAGVGAGNTASMDTADEGAGAWEAAKGMFKRAKDTLNYGVPLEQDRSGLKRDYEYGRDTQRELYSGGDEAEGGSPGLAARSPTAAPLGETAGMVLPGAIPAKGGMAIARGAVNSPSVRQVLGAGGVGGALGGFGMSEAETPEDLAFDTTLGGAVGTGAGLVLGGVPAASNWISRKAPILRKEIPSLLPNYGQKLRNFYNAVKDPTPSASTLDIELPQGQAVDMAPRAGQSPRQGPAEPAQAGIPTPEEFNMLEDLQTGRVSEGRGPPTPSREPIDVPEYSNLDDLELQSRAPSKFEPEQSFDPNEFDPEDEFGQWLKISKENPMSLDTPDFKPPPSKANSLPELAPLPKTGADTPAAKKISKEGPLPEKTEVDAPFGPKTLQELLEEAGTNRKGYQDLRKAGISPEDELFKESKQAGVEGAITQGKYGKDALNRVFGGDKVAAAKWAVENGAKDSQEVARILGVKVAEARKIMSDAGIEIVDKKKPAKKPASKKATDSED